MTYKRCSRICVPLSFHTSTPYFFFKFLYCSQCERRHSCYFEPADNMCTFFEASRPLFFAISNSYWFFKQTHEHVRDKEWLKNKAYRFLQNYGTTNTPQQICVHMTVFFSCIKFLLLYIFIWLPDIYLIKMNVECWECSPEIWLGQYCLFSFKDAHLQS